ncbi:MAG: ABC-2 type transport system ATP-binding protein [Planctomycetota bacterium]
MFLSVFGLRDRLGSRLITLSKGMRQKVLLTAAVLHRPTVLFVDEPLSGLDVDSAALIKEFFRLYTNEGRAVLYCSHVLDVVERVCDSITILNHGQVAAQGSFEELSARMQEASLEEIFGQLTGQGKELERAQALAAALFREDAKRPLE